MNPFSASVSHPTASFLEYVKSPQVSHGLRSRIFALAVLSLAAVPLRADLPAIDWTESFEDDPVAAGRFFVPGDHDPSRFIYESSEQRLVVQYDSFLPTAWYVRLLDTSGSRLLGRCDDFELTVTFRIRSGGFYADPFQFAQIGWGLINLQTTGMDRAGGAGPDFAFDCVAFDYYPNVSPQFGGPTIGPTVIHSDTGQGYFSQIEFPFGAESEIDTKLGEESITLDVVHVARVRYDGGARIATLTLSRDGLPVSINADGEGGSGGPDGDPTTVQTILVSGAPFAVDALALTAWQDTFNPFGDSVIAEVEFSEISFHTAAVVAGDLNRDGALDGLDVAPFVEAILFDLSGPCALARADFNDDDELTFADVDGFVAALVGTSR